LHPFFLISLLFGHPVFLPFIPFLVKIFNSPLMRNKFLYLRKPDGFFAKVKNKQSLRLAESQLFQRKGFIDSWYFICK